MLRRTDSSAEGYVSRNGVRTHYQVFGEGPRAILLLPTWSIVHSDFWRHQVPFLADGYTVVAFDGRGNGASDRPEDARSYSEHEFAADAVAVLDALEIEQAAIISSSQGACWGTILAATNPQRVPAGVFIAPDLPFGPPTAEQGPAYEAFDERLPTHEGWWKWNRHYWREHWPDFLEFFFSKCFTEPDSAREIRHFYEMGLETTPEVITATIQAPGLDEAEAERLTASLQCSTLVIHGDGDEISPLRRGQEMAKLCGAEMLVLPGSGHEPHCRSPVEVNRHIAAFLDRSWPPRGR